MPDNVMHADREDRIRRRAYALWQEAGCPTGQADIHWADATRQIDAEDAPESLLLDTQQAAAAMQPAAEASGRH
jgi:hypothetical protein